MRPIASLRNYKQNNTINKQNEGNNKDDKAKNLKQRYREG